MCPQKWLHINEVTYLWHDPNHLNKNRVFQVNYNEFNTEGLNFKELLFILDFIYYVYFPRYSGFTLQSKDVQIRLNIPASGPMTSIPSDPEED